MERLYCFLCAHCFYFPAPIQRESHTFLSLVPWVNLLETEILVQPHLFSQVMHTDVVYAHSVSIGLFIVAPHSLLLFLNNFRLTIEMVADKPKEYMWW